MVIEKHNVSEADIEKARADDLLYEKLANDAKWHVCAECGGLLVVVWDGKANTYELKCGPNKAHIGTKSWRESPREKEREARQMAVDAGKMELTKFSGKTDLTQIDAKTILVTLWPDAPSSEVLKAALICRQYGLNPLMRHIYLVGYVDHKTGVKEWSILIGIGATRMIARRSGPYSYEDNTPRLMTEGEQMAILGEVDPNRYWAITVLRDREGMKAQGYGNWGKADSVKGANKGNTPQNMAFIRSERAALDKLFPEKLPVGEVMAGEYMPEPVISSIPESPPPRILASREDVSVPISPAGEGDNSRAQGPGGKTSNTVAKDEGYPPVQNWGDMAAKINNLGVTSTSVISRAGYKRWQDFTDNCGGVEGGFRKAWEIAQIIKAEKLIK